MAYIDNIIIPFRRRDKRDLSLSRITTSPINLDSNYSAFKTLLLNPSYRKRKRNKSQFAQNLLNEILPETLPKVKTTAVIQNTPKKKRNSTSKTTLIKNSSSNVFNQLEEIPEQDPLTKIVKRYEKNCNIKRHQISNKLISNFLTPVNSFISTQFRLNMEDYGQLTTQIKNRKGFPPRIPNIKKSFHSITQKN